MPYDWNRGQEPKGNLPKMAAAVLQKILFSIFLSFTSFNCASGRGGFLGNLLSWRGLLPLSRLTLGVYIIHYPLYMVFYSTSRERIYFSAFNLVSLLPMSYPEFRGLDDCRYIKGYHFLNSSNKITKHASRMWNGKVECNWHILYSQSQIMLSTGQAQVLEWIAAGTYMHFTIFCSYFIISWRDIWPGKKCDTFRSRKSLADQLKRITTFACVELPAEREVYMWSLSHS